MITIVIELIKEGDSVPTYRFTRNYKCGLSSAHAFAQKWGKGRAEALNMGYSYTINTKTL